MPDAAIPERSVTVLVADDNEVAQRLCRRVLEKAGYSVLTASDGLEAVAIAMASSPDLILIDVQKPGMAIVIASAHSMASDRERFLAAGADDVLSKPFRLTDLTAVVERLVANGTAP